MQSDKFARCACKLAADAGRSVIKETDFLEPGGTTKSPDGKHEVEMSYAGEILSGRPTLRFELTRGRSASESSVTVRYGRQTVLFSLSLSGIRLNVAPARLRPYF